MSDEVFGCSPQQVHSSKRICKAILWEATKDFWTWIIRALCTTKEIRSRRGLSSPLNTAVLGITDAYIRVPMKYLGSSIHNYNILCLMMFPPGPVFKKKSKLVERDELAYSYPSSPSCPSPTCPEPHCFHREKWARKGNLWRTENSRVLRAWAHDPVLAASGRPCWSRMKVTNDSLCSYRGNQATPSSPALAQLWVY